MKRTTLFLMVFAVLFIPLAAAQEHDFTEGKRLIDSGISCSKLTDGQLEEIGEYYMEQMHPGEAHELMDKMMGGEGSSSLRQAHISIARRLYCNEGDGMMGMMGGSMMGNGMMGYPYGYGYGYFSLLWVLAIAALLVFAIWAALRYGMLKKPSPETPLEILRKRFAKGEITRKQFEEIRKKL